VADIATLYTLGFALILVGVLILIVASVLVAFMRGKKEKMKAAGVIIIGPVPIIFGTDKKAVKTILVLSIILTVSLIAGMLIYYFLLR